jgi:hypothetical protein
MKIIRSAMLVMALACSVYAGDIPYGVAAAGEMPNGVSLLTLLLILL